MSEGSKTDCIRIFLRDCKTELRVGIYEAETKKAQPVMINVEVEADARHHFRNLAEKKLDHTLDYEPIYDFIRNELPQLGHIPLLESVAEVIIEFCFRDPRIQKARVRIEKLEIFTGTAGTGIEICRTRQKS